MAVPIDLSKEDPINFKDINYQGYPFYSNQTFMLEKGDVVQNIVKMFLMSQKGDYGRRLNMGGPMFELIGKKALSEEALKDYITTALKPYTQFKIVDIFSKFNSDIRAWAINIHFIDTVNRIDMQTSFGLQV